MKQHRRTKKDLVPSKKRYNGINNSEKIEAQILSYSSEGFLCEISDFDFNLFELKIAENSNTWFNLHGLHNEAIVEQIGNHLNLDTLVIQNILDTTIRPKVQDYDDVLFFSVKSLTTLKSESKFEQISFVLSQNYILSFQEKRGDHFSHIRERIRQNKGIVCAMGHDYLLYLLLEALLDNYYDKLDKTFEKIQKFNYKYLLANIATFNLEKIEYYKIMLNDLKRSLSPMKEFLITIEKSNHKTIKLSNRKYFTDLKDHTNILLEEIDYQQKQLETAANIFFSLQNQKLNEVMKTLTIISSIFIPITFVAGVYGMNFSNMPELETKYGYFIVLAIMAILVIGPILYFKKKKWF